MPTKQTKKAQPLSRERVLDAAMALADEIGLEAFTIRKLANSLDVGPMTIYHHIPSKEAIIDGMVDRVFEQIDLPQIGDDWRVGIRARCVSARSVLRKHPWAPPVMESRRNPGHETLQHHDAVLACLRAGGLSLQLTAHAYAVLDSYVYGFALEEAHLPGGGEGEIVELAQEMLESMALHYPALAEFSRDHVSQPGYSFGQSFEFGLDLIIDGIWRAAEAAST